MEYYIIWETHQTETGVKVPEPLQKNMLKKNRNEIPFVKFAPIGEEAGSKKTEKQEE